MIASPSDVPEARDAVERAIHGWNDANAVTKGVVLMPWRWESSAVPVLGGTAQELINGQGVDDSDIVFALFGSRLGLPTSAAVSGTVEEIERAEGRGTPVHCYFSTQPLPNDVDVAQLSGLREFREALARRGLLGEFSSASQLEHEVWKAIEFDLSRMEPLAAAPTNPTQGVDFSVQPQEEREIRDYDKKGKPRYTTRRWIDVTNDGTVDAEGVVFDSVGDDPMMELLVDAAPTVIHSKQTRRVPMIFMMGSSTSPVLGITWVEDGETQRREFHVG
jgi:hypothetical protein